MQSSEEGQREAKYNLLKERIVDGGFDPLAFQVFCEQMKRGGGDDIDAWDYQELNQAISAYIEKEELQISKSAVLRKSISNRNEESKKDVNQFNTPTAQPQSQIVGNASNIKQGPSQFQAASRFIDDVNYQIEIECKMPSRSPLTDYILENEHKPIEIIMNDFMTKSEGIFSSGYGAFKVETSPLGWSVWRRFSDFAWLRQVLQKAFPLQLIPPIPKKKIKVNATDSTYLQKRMRVLELFVQNCYHHPLFRSHPAFSDFLQMSDEPKFKEKQNAYDRNPIPARPAEFTTVSGTCTLEVSDKLKNYALTLQDYLKNSNEVYKKLGLGFKKLFLDLDTLSSTLQQIADSFTGLSKVTELFCRTNQEECSGELSQIKDVYTQLSILMQGWYSGTIFQMKNVKENFYEFFRFHRKMQDQAQEFLTQRNQMASKFTELKNKLQEKKEKLFVIGDTTKWDLPMSEISLSLTELQHNKTEAMKVMLPSETRALEVHRENYAFINRKLPEEMNEIMGFRSKVYIKKFLRVAHMRALETAKLHHVLADFLQVSLAKLIPQNLSEMQGQLSGQLNRRTNSLYIDAKYDTFFGVKPQMAQK